MHAVYRANPISATTFARFADAGLLESLSHLASEGTLPIRCCRGTAEESERAEAALSGAGTIILEPSALATLFFSGEFEQPGCLLGRDTYDRQLQEQRLDTFLSKTLELPNEPKAPVNLRRGVLADEELVGEAVLPAVEDLELSGRRTCCRLPGWSPSGWIDFAQGLQGLRSIQARHPDIEQHQGDAFAVFLVEINRFPAVRGQPHIESVSREVIPPRKSELSAGKPTESAKKGGAKSPHSAQRSLPSPSPWVSTSSSDRHACRYKPLSKPLTRTAPRSGGPDPRRAD